MAVGGHRGGPGDLIAAHRGRPGLVADERRRARHRIAEVKVEAERGVVLLDEVRDDVGRLADEDHVAAVVADDPGILLRRIGERLVGQVGRVVADIATRAVDADELRRVGRQVALEDALAREARVALVIGREIIGQAREDDVAAVGTQLRGEGAGGAAVRFSRCSRETSVAADCARFRT